jgi:hypothetical protein
MKKIFLPVLLAFSLFTGFLSGYAYNLYFSREECLQKTFLDNTTKLSPEEIENITNALNAVTETDENKEIDKDISDGDNNQQQTSSQFVGSRNSNKFYPVECRYAKLIKEENKVYFQTIEEGEKAGRKYVECK